VLVFVIEHHLNCLEEKERIEQTREEEYFFLQAIERMKDGRNDTLS